MGSFLVFLFLMHIILYKPFLKTISERDRLVKTDLDGAEEAEKKRKSILEKIDQDMMAVRLEAKEIMAEARAQAAEDQKHVIEKAQAEAVGIVDQAATELRAAVEVARKKLKADVDALAETIAERLVRGES